MVTKTTFPAFASVSMLLLCVIQGIHCGVIPELTVKRNSLLENDTAAEFNSLEGDNLDNSYDQKRLNCMWLAYQAMLTGNEKYLTQECVSLFLSPSNEGEKDSESMELQNELHDLSSQQLRAIQSDYDVNNKRASSDESGIDVSQATDTSSKAKTVEQPTGKEDAIEPLTVDEIDAPFLTSVKEINEDFLVIPVKYLKSQLGDDANAITNDDAGDNKNSNQLEENAHLFANMDKKKREKDTAKMDLPGAGKSTDSVKWEDVENWRNALVNRQNENDRKQGQVDFDVLHQVQADIGRLENDLKAMETKTV